MKSKNISQMQINSLGLQKPFISIKNDHKFYYGGNQNWCKSKIMRQSGCGAIAIANILCQVDKFSKGIYSISKKEYMELVNKLGRFYLHPIQGLGINGIHLTIGFNIYCLTHHIKLKGHWGTFPSRIWERVDEMLNKGFPVVMAVGPNKLFHKQKHRLNLYTKGGDGYEMQCTCRGHFVTITNMDKDYVTVSSWGEKYYISKKQYEAYLKKYSNCFFTNIFIVDKR